MGDQRLEALQHLAPVGVERVERARPRQHLQRPLADPAQVHPRREVEQVGERAARRAPP